MFIALAINLYQKLSESFDAFYAIIIDNTVLALKNAVSPWILCKSITNKCNICFGHEPS